MRSTTKAALMEIGWATILASYPATAINMMGALRPESDAGKAKRDHKLVVAVQNEVESLSQALEALPESIISDIDIWSADENELEDGVPSFTADALYSMQKILNGLKVVQEDYEGLIRKTGPGIQF